MIAGGTDRARREEMPGSKVTSAPRAPVPARANTGRWAGLSTWCGVRSEPACRGGGRARDARSRSIAPRRSSHPPPVARIDPSARQRASAAEELPQKGCRRRRREGGRRRRRAASRAARGRVRGVRGTACAACAARRARAAARPAAAAEPREVHSIGQGARLVDRGLLGAGGVSEWVPPWVLVGSVGDARAYFSPSPPKSCRWRRPQSKGRSCVSGRARRDLRVRGGRGHLSERPGWPRGAPISRGGAPSP